MLEILPPFRPSVINSNARTNIMSGLGWVGLQAGLLTGWMELIYVLSFFSSCELIKCFF